MENSRKLFKVIAVILSVVMACSVFSLGNVKAADGEEPKAEIATWEGWRNGAVSFTFEDGAPSQVTDAAPLFDKYGYKASFYLVMNWNPNWSGFQTMADNGHEIGSHSNTHGQNMSGEEASSKAYINSKIKQKYGCISVAYPNGNVPNESAVKQNYVAGRTYNGSWWGGKDTISANGPSNWCKVPAYMTGTDSDGNIDSTEKITAKMQAAVDKNEWVVFASFGFTGKKNGAATFSPTDLDAIEGALAWAQENDSDIWVAPLGYVAMYIKERKASKIEMKSSDDTCMTFTLTHSIKDKVCDYNYPLSVRVKLLADYLAAEVKQDGVNIESKVEDGWVYFSAVPNGGDIVISNPLYVTTPKFDTVKAGYVQPAFQRIIITNMSNKDITINSVNLSGSNKDAFILNKNDGITITANSTEDVAYNIQPKEGLSPGTYTATVNILYGSNSSVTVDVSFTVTEAENVDPINEVKNKIDSLPSVDKITVNDKATIEAARADYDKLSKDEKAKAGDEILKKLAAAEAALKKAEENAGKKYSSEWVNGKWYNADGTQDYAGVLQWKSDAVGWWVEDTSGWYPVSDWQKIDGIWYYFNSAGYMAANEYYNGYWFNSDGSWDSQYFLTWKSNSTGWWVEDISGWWPASQWLRVDGCWYYFDANGYMVTSQYVDGYWIGADGVCQ